MPIRRNPIDEAARRARQQVEQVVNDARNLRLSGGLSQASMGAFLGCSRQLIGAIEGDQLEDIGCIQLARLAAAVGLDVTIRAYPAGSPLRDAEHVRLLERFRALLGNAWTWQTESPVSTDPRDRRAIDALLLRHEHRVGVEGITRLVDAQGQTRSILLKQAAAGLDRMVLVLADTRHNRNALVEGAPTLQPAFPLPQRALMRELTAGRLPPANGIVLA
jgi:transcriptional regulator with XRE-family HTH domain